MTSFAIHPLTPDRWGDFVDLFSRKGPRGGSRNAPAYGCWCMWWRNRSLGHGEPKRRAMKRIVAAGGEPGLLAYAGDTAVGWVSIAPREQYAALVRSPQYRPRDEDENVWSIVCFTVDKPLRGGDVVDALLDAAVAHACARGAAAVEAYGHVSDARDYMGSRELYVAHGFEPVREAAKRVVLRRRCP